MRQQLWRYYPQMLKITDDLAAPWLLELWAIAPTPAKARQLRKRPSSGYSSDTASAASMPIPCFAAARARHQGCAEGVAEAASIHLRSLVARLRVVNRELRQAERKLDELCTTIGETEATSGDAFNDRTC